MYRSASRLVQLAVIFENSCGTCPRPARRGIVLELFFPADTHAPGCNTKVPDPPCFFFRQNFRFPVGMALAKSPPIIARSGI